MKNWNLRTLVLMRSLCMLMLPFWILMIRVGLPMSFVWFPLYCAVILIRDKLNKGIIAQMDECAQALLDRLTRHMEDMIHLLAVGMIVFLVMLPKAEDPGAMGLVAARILAWGIFGIHLYRGISFWVRDRMGLIC